MPVLLVACAAGSQVLPIPPRPSGALEGSAVAAALDTLSQAEREEWLYREILSGNVPQFLRTFVPMTVRANIDGNERVLVWHVLPDYLAVGSEDDYILMPMTPMLAQRLADTLGCILPTRRMVDAIYSRAPLKLPPKPIPPSPAMTTVPVFGQHNDSIRIQRKTAQAQYPLGVLVAGHKKDVIISNAMISDLRPNVSKPVVIYGWHRPDGVPIQPLYNGHGETYADYSHGIRLVKKMMVLDGEPVSAESILADETLCILLSDEGVIANPRYKLESTLSEDGGN
jgi:hypothetical protein